MEVFDKSTTDLFHQQAPQTIIFCAMLCLAIFVAPKILRNLQSYSTGPRASIWAFTSLLGCGLTLGF